MNDYTKFSIKKPEETPKVEVEEIQNGVEEVPMEEPVIARKHGVVEGCLKLNVREKPSIKSEVVRVIGVGDDLVIDEQESTEDFYKVSVDNGFEGFNGFCMKKFIKLVP